MDATVQAAISEMLVELPGARRPLCVLAMRDVLANFLLQTQVLTAELDAIDIEEDTYLYALTLPSGYDGFKIAVPTIVVLNDEKQRDGIDWRMSGTSIQLRDIPTEDITDGLEITVALALDDIAQCSIAGLSNWTPGIIAGAKARMMRAPGKPYSDKQTAFFYEQEYKDAISRALTHAATDGLNAPMRLTM